MAGSLYDARWQRFRAAFLRANPLCVMCEAIGRITQATVVDHIRPHRGNVGLFYAPGNHQSLCKPCHDRHKQRQEKSGTLRGCDVDGRPLDPDHHWKASE